VVSILLRLLETSSLSFAEITFQAGYEDSSSFRRVFIKTVGLRPKEYQQKFRYSPWLPFPANWWRSQKRIVKALHQLADFFCLGLSSHARSQRPHLGYHNFKLLHDLSACAMKRPPGAMSCRFPP
jgi:hypothetical protein